MAEVVEIPKNPPEVWVRYPTPGRPRATSSRFGYQGGIVVFIIFVIILLLAYNRGTIPITADADPRLVVGPIETTVSATPILSIEPKVVTEARPITDVKYVVADQLNMREEPTEHANVSHVLPRGTRVECLGESHRENDGDIWLRVRIATFVGKQIGWVDHRYVQ